MPENLRSNDGCWTCRVRRKKCDETRPVCLTCTSLHLPCHGYGAKPTWMDRGVQERKVAVALRDAVKKELGLQRQARQSRGVSGARSDQFMVSPSTDPLPVEEVSLLNPSQIILSSDASPNTKSAAEIDDATRDDAISTILTKDSWSVVPVQFEEDQAGLLMHFFDHVLPLQFRFYNPSILEGGRGWLLSIITRTKPLYNVALSLAAYHQQSVLVRGSGVSCQASLAKLQERHIECIKALRHYLAGLSARAEGYTWEETVDIMASISLLIALELFRGDTSDWQMHLQAVSTLSHKLKWNQLQKGPSYHTHKRAMEFFTGVITWYDILSCASTGLKPFSSFDYVDEAPFPHIQFDRLMGCETWTMRLIQEIATLGEWKSRMEATGTLSTWELVRRAADIEMRLETSLIASSRQQREATPSYVKSTAAMASLSESYVKDVTGIFASAAMVYLQVIVSGPNPAIPEIQQGVWRTMAALDTLKDKDLVRNLLWPICIAGCMAMPEHESYWRDLISSVNWDRWSFGYPSKVLMIMEECWRLRKCQPETAHGVDWMMAMKNLNMRILLV